MKVLATVAPSVEVTINIPERRIMRAPQGTHIPKQNCREEMNSVPGGLREKSVNRGAVWCALA